ncbi:hypothetical protein [Catenulispora subtropica]|uniref:hypothetical protein n=1 Tax=Catenulispora subtropica TaxID=450798 RepID=UPI0031D39D7E
MSWRPSAADNRSRHPPSRAVLSAKTVMEVGGLGGAGVGEVDGITRCGLRAPVP